MNDWKKSDSQYEKFVPKWPKPWTKDWFNVYWPMFPHTIFILVATFGNFLGDLIWETPLFSHIHQPWGIILFLMMIPLGFIWVINYRKWMRKQILEYKKKNLIR